MRGDQTGRDEQGHDGRQTSDLSDEQAPDQRLGQPGRGRRDGTS